MDEKQRKERQTGIGGSDAPAACGMSPWKTPYQLWCEKRGETGDSQEDNEPMFWGRTLEPVIRQRYADVTGKTVTIPKGIIRHPKYGWMIASLDGLTDDPGVLEIKTSRTPTDWGEPGTNEIPDVYMIQVQHYLTVTKLSVADVAVLIGGNDFRIYEVPEDRELQELIMEKEAGFWQMVKDGIPPDVVSYADVRQRWGKTSKGVDVVAELNIIAAINRLKEIKELSKEEEQLKAVIMAYMKEGDRLVNGENKVIATWQLDKPSKRLDTKALKAAEPEIYKQFLKESEPSRRFLIK